jgi:hypothetical protein
MRYLIGMTSAWAMLTVPASPASAQQGPFRLQEATIASIHTALAAGQVTCMQLTRLYLDRIAAYDLQGPALHAIITVNPQANGHSSWDGPRLPREPPEPRRRPGGRGCRGSRGAWGAALHPGHPQGQLQHLRHADDGRQYQHENIAASRRRLHGGEDTQGRGADPGQGEPPGVRAGRHVDFEPGRSGPQPLRPGPHPRRLQRRHRRGDRCKFCGARHRQRHRPVDTLSRLRQQSCRHPPDPRPGEPGRRHPQQPDTGRGRPDRPHGDGRRAAARRYGRLRPGRSHHRLRQWARPRRATRNSWPPVPSMGRASAS